MDRARFSKIIYTRHAVERRVVRRISKNYIQQAIRNPDRTEREEDQDTKFIKTINGRKLHVVAKPLADEDAWLIKTIFVRGEEDPNILTKYALTGVVRLFPGFFR